MSNMKAQSYQQIINRVSRAWAEQHPAPMMDGGSYVVDTFPDGYVVVNIWEPGRDEYFKIAFTEADGEYTFAARSEWEEVERSDEWVAKSTEFRQQLENESVSVLGGKLKARKSEDGLLGYVEEIGIKYTDPETPDLTGDFFTDESYFGKRSGNGVDATLNHRIPIKTGNKAANAVLAKMSAMIFKHPVKAVKTELGLVAQHVLDLADAYEKFVFDLVEKGAFRWSAGSAPHLYDREKKGNAFFVKRFDIAEFAYTPTAANPNNPRIRAVKSLSNNLTDEVLKGVSVPNEGAGDAREMNAGNGITIKAENVIINQQKAEDPATEVQKDMTEKVEDKKVDETPSLGDQINAAVKAAVAEIQPKAQPANEDKGEDDVIQKAVAATIKALKETNAGDPYGFAPVGDEPKEDDGEDEPMHPAQRNSLKSRYLRFERGDTEDKAMKAWIMTGDGGTVDAGRGIHLRGDQISLAPLKASNATIMNITTAGDGGSLVPTGHVNAIAARRDEDMLAQKLGCLLAPGVGTTVNYPYDNEADGEFVSTTEQVDAYTNVFDVDTPAISKKALTLTKYSKAVPLTDELQQDEASNLMAFLENFVGRGMAKTHNSLLLTEVASNGTSLKTFSVATAIADGDLEDIEGNDDLGGYLDSPNVAWVMRNSTLSYIRQVGSTSTRHYKVVSDEGPNLGDRSLLGYPVFRSNKAAAIAASAKSVYFGAWDNVAYRLAPDIQVLRNPYKYQGLLILEYYFRTVYGVLIAEAIGYGVHGTATA